MTKPYVEYDRTQHGEYRTARENGICPWCKLAYKPGDKINWNPRVGGTKAHAGCYKAYGSPIPDTSSVSSVGTTPGKKPFIPYDELKHGEYQISKFRGVCKWCGLLFSPGDKVNWTPKVKGTACHASCYAEYGPPIPQPQQETESEPRFIPNPNPTPKPVTETPTESTGLPKAIVDAIIPYLEQRLKNLVTKEQVESVLDRILEGRTLKTVTTITIERETELGIESEDLGVQHKCFPQLLQRLQARDHNGYRLNMMLIGPAGTGKTTAAENAAKALGLRFMFSGAIDTKYDYLGYTDVNGKLVRTPFREIWENGGVFLQDELDGSNATALLPWNAGLANHIMAFPDGLVKQHKDCIIICAMNTWGLGATNDFVGRTKLDATTVNRYVPLYWDIDEQLEHAMAQNSEWVKRVQKVRANIKQKGIRGIMITPRQSAYGAALLRAGVPQAEIEESLLRQSMNQTDWESVRS